MEHDLVQEHPIYQSHIFIQVGPISCSQRSKRFHLQQKDHHDTNAHLHLCGHRECSGRYNEEHPLTQVTRGLVMNCSRRGVKISFSILQLMYLRGKKKEPPQKYA